MARPGVSFELYGVSNSKTERLTTDIWMKHPSSATAAPAYSFSGVFDALETDGNQNQ
jgi:hypothetical protein